MRQQKARKEKSVSRRGWGWRGGCVCVGDGEVGVGWWWWWQERGELAVEGVSFSQCQDLKISQGISLRHSRDAETE